MKVWMIWVMDPCGEFVWLQDAMDDDTTAENWQGWESKVKEAMDTHGGENVRVTTTTVDIDKVFDAFKFPEI